MGGGFKTRVYVGAKRSRGRRGGGTCTPRVYPWISRYGMWMRRYYTSFIVHGVKPHTAGAVIQRVVQPL